MIRLDSMLFAFEIVIEIEAEESPLVTEWTIVYNAESGRHQLLVHMAFGIWILLCNAQIADTKI